MILLKMENVVIILKHYSVEYFKKDNLTKY